jgi:hypothetical protein
MNEKEIRLLIANLAEGVASTERTLGQLAAGILALRDATLECGDNEFRALYARHFEGKAASELRERSLQRSELLLGLAVELRRDIVRRH